jgi:heme-degrading monooxygenase HmoA
MNLPITATARMGLVLAVAAGTAAAQTVDAPAAAPVPTVAIVTVPKPWYVPQFVIAGKMRDTIPQYAAMPGLAFKMYSFAQADGQFGGLYFWRSRAEAQAWFNPAWFERVRRQRGVEGTVRLFDAPVSVDAPAGAPRADDHGSYVATLVLLPTPAGTTRARLEAAFRAAVPEYRGVPGLLRKHFIASDDGRFGGVYLWRDRAAADAWFNAAWHERVRRQYAAEAHMEWFDVPILTPTTLADNTVALPQ